MNTYYEILGLEPNASQLEIKKAYFKRIRQYPPESDPVMFEKIRKAYETLKHADSQPDEPVFPLPENDLAREILSQIQTYKEAQDYELLRDTCEKAFLLFPNEIQFCYLLISAQLACGNSGKAIKNAEWLVQQQPENKWFQKQLALSYFERGYVKKSYPVFAKAYELGCRDMDFILNYAFACEQNKDCDKGIQLLQNTVSQKEEWHKDEIDNLAEAYIAMFALIPSAKKASLTELLPAFCHTFKQYQSAMVAYWWAFCNILTLIAKISDLTPEHIRMMDDVFDVLQNACTSPSDKENVQTFRLECACYRLAEDSRIGEILTHYCDVLYFSEDMSPHLLKFAKTDLELCLIEQLSDSLEQALIIQEEYPLLYTGMKDFFDKLQQETELSILKESLKKTYKRMAPSYEGGFYDSMYPNASAHLFGTFLNKGYEDQPYLRPEAKIGRNDPCPCGSGKKYKKCCMNNSKR